MTKIVRCPVHKDEVLRRLKYWSQKGKNQWSNWWLCPKCDKPFKIEFKMSTLEGDKI